MRRHRTPSRYLSKSAANPATPTRTRWLVPGLTFLLLGSLLTYTLTVTVTSNPPQAATPTVEAPTVTAPAVTKPLGATIDFIVRRNDTLERIFRQLKLSLDDLATILDLPGVRQRLNQLRPGEKLNVVHEDGLVHALNRRISETEVLSVKRADSGFAVDVVTTPIEIRRTHAYGTINSSLFAAASAAGVNPETTLRLANDIFGWDIDFALDIRSGDRFSLTYEQKYRDGEYIGDARILAAEFINDGQTHRAVFYASADGTIADYFTPDGRSMRRQFLRAPLDFTRVSSNFNLARRHPILNIIRAHQGVDYVAPTGTIIKAAGDGRVDFVGMKGGYGRVVVLEHGGGVSTLYGHMSRFAKGLRDGQRIKQGDTIGYVGSSGAATGPHLHYEYRINGIHKNPRTVQLPDAAPIPAAYVAEFQARSETLLADLQLARDAAVAVRTED